MIDCYIFLTYLLFKIMYSSTAPTIHFRPERKRLNGALKGIQKGFANSVRMALVRSLLLLFFSPFF